MPAGNPDGGQWTDGSGGGDTRLPRRKPVPHPSVLPHPPVPHPMADSPHYDPVTGIYDPPLNPALSPFDLIGGVAKPAAGAIGSGARSAYNALRLRRYLAQARQIPKGVREAGRGTEHLTAGQRENLRRFMRKGTYFKKPEVINYSDGRALYSVKVPASNIPKSYAIYEKQVSAGGKTIRTSKTVIGSNGELIHIKPK